MRMENTLQVRSEDVMTELKRYLFKELCFNPEYFESSADFESDLGLDSIDRASLIVHLEDTFGVETNCDVSDKMSADKLTKLIVDLSER